jgi:chromosome segregation ATPase
MEPTQTTQMVSWLDEERRKDKALIVRLEERVAAQAALLEDLARRVQGQESDLGSVRSTAMTIGLFDESISRIRNELSSAITQFEGKSADIELKRIHDLIREGTNKAIEDVRQEVLARIEREQQPRRAEEERLSRVALELQNYADSLGKNMDEFQRSLTYLEEQRRQDSKRLTDVHSGSTESGKRIEGLQAKSELLEELARRNERSLTELSATILEMQQQRQTNQEQETITHQQREKLLSDTLKRIEDSMASYTKQHENWAETSRTMKKNIQEFERIAERVERRFNEVSEMQRLSEERFRHEWDDFQQDDQKRFRQFTLTNEEAWRENSRLTKTMVEDIARLNEITSSLVEQVATQSTAQKDIVDNLISSLQGLTVQANGQLKSKKK